MSPDDSATTPVGAAPASPDRRHPLDPVSLVAGVVAVLLAGVYLLGELTGLEVGGAAVRAVVTIVLALGVLAVALRRLARR